MANDRIYMECLGCHEQVMLAKHYPTPGASGVWFPEKVTEFINKHIECNPNYFNINLNGDPGFRLFTESDYDPNR